MNAGRSNILSLLTFRPYGSSLITPGARLWLTTTWVLAVLIAGIEAWVVTALLEQLDARLWVRILAGLAIFSAIFLIDASFVLLDTSASSATFEGKRQQSRIGPWSRVMAAVLVRAGLFLTTFLITIPVASLALLDDELSEERNMSWQKEVDAAQVQQTNELRAEVQRARDRLAEIRQLWTDEVNANETANVSGRAGVGARARKYERDQRKQEAELRAAQTKLDSFRAQMADSTLEERAQVLGVQPHALTFAERSEIMTRIGNRPGVEQKTTMVKAYLLMAFAAVVLLKLLSPTAVSSYLSEELQEARRRAEEGGYDHLLRYGPEGVVPAQLGQVDFRHWYVEVLPALRQRREAINTVYESRASLEAHRGALDYAVAATRMVAGQEEQAREKMALAQLEVTRLKRQIDRQQVRLEATAKREDRMAGSTLPEAMATYATLAERRAEEEDALVAQEGQLYVAEQRLLTRQADLDRVRQRRALADKREQMLRENVAEIEESHLRKVTEASKGMGEDAIGALHPTALGLYPDEQAEPPEPEEHPAVPLPLEPSKAPLPPESKAVATTQPPVAKAVAAPPAESATAPEPAASTETAPAAKAAPSAKAASPQPTAPAAASPVAASPKDPSPEAAQVTAAVKPTAPAPPHTDSAITQPFMAPKPAPAQAALLPAQPDAKPDAEAKPAAAKPDAEAKPAAAKPEAKTDADAEAKPAAAKPEAKPDADAKPAAAKPEAKPAAAKPEAKPEAKPAAAKPAAAKPDDRPTTAQLPVPTPAGTQPPGAPAQGSVAPAEAAPKAAPTAPPANPKLVASQTLPLGSDDALEVPAKRRTRRSSATKAKSKTITGAPPPLPNDPDALAEDAGRTSDTIPKPPPLPKRQRAETKRTGTDDTPTPDRLSLKDDDEGPPSRRS